MPPVRRFGQRCRPCCLAEAQGKPSSATTELSTRSDTTDIAQSPVAPSEDLPPAPPRYRRPWHELLKRVFDFDLVCGRRGAKMHHISHIEDPQVIDKILGHLGLTDRAAP
jgi:hypothetical protein